MDGNILISAISLFAGVSLLPAVFFLLRDKEVTLERDYRFKGKMAILMALLLAVLAGLFVINVVAQDLALLLVSVALLVLLPMFLIRVDKKRRAPKA